MSRRVYEDVPCPFCGCLCDDIGVTVEDNTIKEVRRGCSISRSKFLNYAQDRLGRPMIRENGSFVQTSLERALERAAEILASSQYPLIYGWSSTCNEAQKVGIELAEILGGAIDNTSTVCHGPSFLAVQGVGSPHATLGDVSTKADLVIYWGCNPMHGHPRHLSRYTVFSKGYFSKRREDRKMVVVDVRETPTARAADLFIKIQPNRDFELLSALRMAVKDEEMDVDSVAGVPIEVVEELADDMVNASYGALFYGLGLTMTAAKSANVDSAILLVRDLNARTKFNIIPMRGHYNVTGCNAVMTWQTGYPFAVDFSLGYPRYNPGETSIIDLLSRGEGDAMLVVAADPVSSFPLEAVKRMMKIPLITFDVRPTPTTYRSEVAIPSAITGIEAEGTAYRMDGVIFKMKKLVDPPSGLPSDQQALSDLKKRVEEKIE
ncbi:MAG: formylmethanofuran dehydrogenase subunit B [Nitrososphaeria archaeon]